MGEKSLPVHCKLGSDLIRKQAVKTVLQTSLFILDSNKGEDQEYPICAHSFSVCFHNLQIEFDRTLKPSILLILKSI